MILEEEVFKVGFLAKPHGLDGYINFHFEYDILETNDCPYLILLLDGIFVPFFIEEYRIRGESALIKLLDVDNSDTALRYQGKSVYFPLEYYNEVMSTSDDTKSIWHQYLNFDVYHNPNQYLGKLTAIDEQTINILLEISTSENESMIVPGVEEWIVKLDKENKKIYMNLPEGLLDS